MTVTDSPTPAPAGRPNAHADHSTMMSDLARPGHGPRIEISRDAARNLVNPPLRADKLKWTQAIQDPPLLRGPSNLASWRGPVRVAPRVGAAPHASLVDPYARPRGVLGESGFTRDLVAPATWHNDYVYEPEGSLSRMDVGRFGRHSDLVRSPGRQSYADTPKEIRMLDQCDAEGLARRHARAVPTWRAETRDESYAPVELVRRPLINVARGRDIIPPAGLTSSRAAAVSRDARTESGARRDEGGVSKRLVHGAGSGLAEHGGYVRMTVYPNSGGFAACGALGPTEPLEELRVRTEAYRLIERMEPGALAPVEGAVEASVLAPGALELLVRPARAAMLRRKLGQTSANGAEPLCYVVDEARPRPYAMIAPTAIDAMEVLRALHKKSGCVPLVHYDVELDRNVFLFDATEDVFKEMMASRESLIFRPRGGGASTTPIALEVTNQYRYVPSTDTFWVHGLTGDAAASRYLLPALEKALGPESKVRLTHHAPSGFYVASYHSTRQAESAVARMCREQAWISLPDPATGGPSGVQVKIDLTQDELLLRIGNTHYAGAKKRGPVPLL